jgi:hypothetical protein
VFNGFTVLYSLEISGASISELPDGIFSGLRGQLEYLHLNDNLLTRFDANQTGLYFAGEGYIYQCTLNLAQNLITRVNLQDSQIEFLNLSFNRITDLADAIISEKDLTILDMSSKQILQMPLDYFANFSRIEEIHFRNNSLQSAFMSFNHNAYYYLTIDFSMNKLTDFNLSFANNEYSSFLKLNLSRNLLYEIFPWEWNIKLEEYIDLSHNSFKAINDSFFYLMQDKIGYTTTLYLDYNQISDIRMTQPIPQRQLSFLDISLSDNLLKVIPDFFKNALNENSLYACNGNPFTACKSQTYNLYYSNCLKRCYCSDDPSLSYSEPHVCLTYSYSDPPSVDIADWYSISLILKYLCLFIVLLYKVANFCCTSRSISQQISRRPQI